jgi:hypothetical protein
LYLYQVRRTSTRTPDKRIVSTGVLSTVILSTVCRAQKAEVQLHTFVLPHVYKVLVLPGTEGYTLVVVL